MNSTLPRSSRDVLAICLIAAATVALLKASTWLAVKLNVYTADHSSASWAMMFAAAVLLASFAFMIERRRLHGTFRSSAKDGVVVAAIVVAAEVVFGLSKPLILTLYRCLFILVALPLLLVCMHALLKGFDRTHRS